MARKKKRIKQGIKDVEVMRMKRDEWGKWDLFEKIVFFFLIYTNSSS